MIAFRTLVQIVFPILLVISLGSIEYLRTTYEIQQLRDKFIASHKQSLKLLKEFFSEDILEGRNAAVYQKCKIAITDSAPSIKVAGLNGEVYCDLASSNNENGVKLYEEIFFEPNGAKAGSIEVGLNFSKIKAELIDRRLHSTFILLITILSVWGILLFFVSSTARSLQLLMKSLSSGKISEIETTSRSIYEKSRVSEIKTLTESLTVMCRQLGESALRTNALTSSLATSKAFAQVAHDMKSPASVLNLILKGGALTPEKEQLLRSASDRILKILESLSPTMQRWKSDVQENRNPSLGSIVQWVVAEKRIEIGQRSISLEYENDFWSDDTPFSFNSTDIARVTSNLLNNAIEATAKDQKLNIVVRLSRESNHWILTFEDNGVGIEDTVLGQIHEGKSLGKKSGYGLGLSHAALFMRQIGGDLEINSVVGLGTKILLRIPAGSKV